MARPRTDPHRSAAAVAADPGAPATADPRRGAARIRSPSRPARLSKRAREPAPAAASRPQSRRPLPTPLPRAAAGAARTGSRPEPRRRPQPDTRIEQLESQLHAVLTERNSLAQSFNELQARLSNAAQAHEARVNAEVEERVGALESQLQAGRRQPRGARAGAAAVGRADRRAGRSASPKRPRTATSSTPCSLHDRGRPGRGARAGRRARGRARAAARPRQRGLQARSSRSSPQQREAADARAHALENDLPSCASRPSQGGSGGRARGRARRAPRAVLGHGRRVSPPRSPVSTRRSRR